MVVFQGKLSLSCKSVNLKLSTEKSRDKVSVSSPKVCIYALNVLEEKKKVKNYDDSSVCLLDISEPGNKNA